MVAVPEMLMVIEVQAIDRFGMWSFK